MPTTERNRTVEAACAALTAALPEAWAIYVYGSAARGDEHQGSDIDLAVLLPPGQRIADPLSLSTQIAESVGRDVDLVELRRVNLDLVQEVLRDGRVLLLRQPEETLAWEAEAMTDYQLFNARRRDILDRYLREPLR